MKSHNGHLILEDKDIGIWDIPAPIQDSNGQVVLDYCPICGEWESGLSKPCQPAHTPGPFSLSPAGMGWATGHVDLNAPEHLAIAEILQEVDPLCYLPSQVLSESKKLKANGLIFQAAPTMLKHLIDAYHKINVLYTLPDAEYNDRAFLQLTQAKDAIAIALAYAIDGTKPK